MLAVPANRAEGGRSLIRKAEIQSYMLLVTQCSAPAQRWQYLQAYVTSNL
jgi:hypothetical protein